MTRELPIIDLEFGVTQLSGNQPLFVELLTSFKDQYQDSSKQIAQLLDEQNWQQGRIYMHTIKGVCANLGLQALNQVSREFEEALKCAAEASVGDMRALSFQYASCLHQTLMEIDALGEQQQVSAASTNQNKGGNPRDVLENMLNNHQFIDSDTLAVLLNELNVDGPLRAAIQDAVDALEYPKALALLAQRKM